MDELLFVVGFWGGELVSDWRNTMTMYYMCMFGYVTFKLKCVKARDVPRLLYLFSLFKPVSAAYCAIAFSVRSVR